MSFLTLEDINTTIYNNQKFHWHEIDLSLFSQESTYTERKYDFCEITKESGTYTGILAYKYSIEIDNDLWSKGFACFTPNGWPITMGIVEFSDWRYEITDNTLVIYAPQSSTYATNFKIRLYMGPLTIESQYRNIRGELEKSNVSLNYNELNSDYAVYYRWWESYSIRRNVSVDLDLGYNFIIADNTPLGYLWVNLVKSDFQFECNQVLTNGKVNTVQLGVDDDYKPSGAMVGDYAPYITVMYGDESLPVQWNPTANDYTFDIDLTNREKETDIPLTIYVEVNEVLNQTETEVRLHTRFETINDLSKVNTLFTNGGIGRLGADITLTSDLTVQNDIYLIGNDYTIDLDGHKIIVPSDKTFKASNTNFRNGVNTIQQNTGSKVGLTDCTFGYCTGLGSVIDCQVDLDSLENPTDFTTNLTRCIIGECETAILHGGDLTVTDCKVQGIISDPAYPYFLYQTDGNATLLQNEFTLINNTQIASDIEFNSCIFICGETAQVNGYSHQELQNNNITQFLETQRNSSVINVTYLYTPISDYITLYSEKGYCHSVSNVDYVFKTNVTPTRSD